MLLKSLLANDLEKLVELQPTGWPDIRISFEEYIKNHFCHPIKAIIDEKIVGVASAITFGSSAWLAHIIVSKSSRNQGIGTVLVKHLLSILEDQKVPSIALIATELGIPVYEKAGFRTISDYKFLHRSKPWTGAIKVKNITPYNPRFYQEILALDRRISGENREKLLKDFLNTACVYLNKKQIVGFYLPNLGYGPIIASTRNAGLALMNYKYAVADEAVLPSENKTGIAFLKQNGFTETSTNGTRMLLGKDIAWKPQHIYSRIGGNYG